MKTSYNRSPVLKALYTELITTGKVHTFRVTGRSFKYSNCTDYRYPISTLCEQNGLPFIMGNDAPRGGRIGEFIALAV